MILIAWDSTKTSGDLVSSSDFNDRTTIIKESVQTVNLATSTVSDGNYATLANLSLDAGDTIKIHASSIDPAATTGLNVVVRNITDSTDIYSDNSAYNSGGDLASGGSGDEVEIRVDNSSGSDQDVNAMVKYEVSSI